jgi:acetyl-CoA acyltransferase 1
MYYFECLLTLHIL